MNENNLKACSIGDLRTKEIINLKDGARLGTAGDVMLDLKTGRLVAIVIPGTYRLMGFLGREEDVVIKWEDIKKIGDDVIIVDFGEEEN